MLEGEFEALLQKMNPSRPLMSMAEKVFRMAWNTIGSSQKARKTKFEKEYKAIDSEIEKLVDHIVDAKSAIVAQRA